MPRNWIGLLIAFALGVFLSGTVMGLVGKKSG
jgi:hypothetical protein